MCRNNFHNRHSALLSSLQRSRVFLPCLSLRILVLFFFGPVKVNDSGFPFLWLINSNEPIIFDRNRNWLFLD